MESESRYKRQPRRFTATLGPENSLDTVPFTTLKISLPGDRRLEKVRLVVRDQSSGKLGSADLVSDGSAR